MSNRKNPKRKRKPSKHQLDLIQHLAFESREVPNWAAPRAMAYILKNKLAYPVPDGRVASEGAGYLTTQRGRMAASVGYWKAAWSIINEREYLEGNRNVRTTRRGDAIEPNDPQSCAFIAFDGGFFRITFDTLRIDYKVEMVSALGAQEIQLKDLFHMYGELNRFVPGLDPAHDMSTELRKILKIEGHEGPGIEGLILDIVRDEEGKIATLQEEIARLKIELEEVSW